MHYLIIHRYMPTLRDPIETKIEKKNITKEICGLIWITMEKVEVPPIHNHPLLPFTRFSYKACKGCGYVGYIYGGYHCNELGCESVFHKECADPLPEINHYSHPDHPLKLLINVEPLASCSQCPSSFENGYLCSICDFKLDFRCATRLPLEFILEESTVHEHPIQLSDGTRDGFVQLCKTCKWGVFDAVHYKCNKCDLRFHVECTKLFPQASHVLHPQHPLKLLRCEEAPDYADNKCLLCGNKFDGRIHHCDVCNFTICGGCMENPPPLSVVSPTTHEHQLYLLSKPLGFTCNACGTQADQSPYFCLQCNFMIHWECIDLPRVININRHDHRISYTRRLGHGQNTCGVCRKKVDGFYGGYSCSKCSNYVVHSRCATDEDVWDMIELEGTPEEPEEDAPFEVIDDNTIKHFSHDHNLVINKDGRILHESTLCKACVFQICSDAFYSCENCDFILHQKCANLPRKKRHVCDNLPFTLVTNDTSDETSCDLCWQSFTGFRYECLTRMVTLDVRCGSIREPLVHQSHQHPLYFSKRSSKSCTECGKNMDLDIGSFSCDECDYSLDFKCALLPQKVKWHRYDDHPLYLSCGESSVDGEYWCEACETKVNSKKWFYTCNDCGVILHISCVVGDFSYYMPGSKIGWEEDLVVSNTSMCRPFCYVCNSQCKLPSIVKVVSKADVVLYICSLNCYYNFNRSNNYSSSDW